MQSTNKPTSHFNDAINVVGTIKLKRVFPHKEMVEMSVRYNFLTKKTIWLGRDFAEDPDLVTPGYPSCYMEGLNKCIKKPLQSFSLQESR